MRLAGFLERKFHRTQYKSLHIDKGAKSVADAGLASLCINLEVVVDEANSHQHAENEPELLEDLKSEFRADLNGFKWISCCRKLNRNL